MRAPLDKIGRKSVSRRIWEIIRKSLATDDNGSLNVEEIRDLTHSELIEGNKPFPCTTNAIAVYLIYLARNKEPDLLKCTE
jgi:hypothetical protein